MDKKSKSDSAIAHWLKGRANLWRRHEELLTSQRGRKDMESENVLEIVKGYRSLSRDVSLARNALPGSQITVYLESLLIKSFDLIHRKPYSLLRQLYYVLRHETPVIIRQMRGAIIASVTIFMLSGIVGWLLVFTYPELVALFASPEMISKVQQGTLWTDGLLNIMPSSILSFSIMTNNIMVTIFSFVLGSFYGLGTLYIMGVNGAMLGGVFAFTYHYGMADRLFEFIIAHGVVELSVIMLAGAAGMKLGEALVRPGNMTRREAFNLAATNASKLVAVGAILLVGAGLIEGFVSPNPAFSLAARVSIGIGYGIFMLLLLSGWIWPKQKTTPPT